MCFTILFDYHGVIGCLSSTPRTCTINYDTQLHAMYKLSETFVTAMGRSDTFPVLRGIRFNSPQRRTHIYTYMSVHMYTHASGAISVHAPCSCVQPCSFNVSLLLGDATLNIHCAVTIVRSGVPESLYLPPSPPIDS